MTKQSLWVVLVLLASCGKEAGPDASSDLGGGDVATGSDVGVTAPADAGSDVTIVDDQGRSAGPWDIGTADSGADVGTDLGVDMAVVPDMAMDCDYRTVNNIAVIEAESLTLNEDWSIETARAGHTGNGYIEWGGAPYNNDPTHGVLTTTIAVETAGRYQMQWHVRIGQGTNTTEHNDAWVRFPDADDFYGLKGDVGAEIRRYPKPQCDDAAFTDAIEADPDVDVADCTRGSTRDGWVKVYSSGATDWRWSTFTSDNDASRIMVEFDAPGVYTLELAARADFFLIDRLVLHLETVSDNDARDLTLAETACP